MKTPHQTRTMEALSRAYFCAIQDELGREEYPQIDEPEDMPASTHRVIVMPKRAR